MKKRFIAFYDAFCFAIIAGIMWSTAIVIFITGHFGDFDWCVENWYLLVVFAICVVVPIGGTLIFRYCVIDNNATYFHYFPFTASWEKAANNIDARWNQDVFISEIKDIEVVKLTEEEKQTKVYYRHWFNKYLKINLKYGNPKYVYVGNYSNYQIKKIIKILTSKA